MAQPSHGLEHVVGQSSHISLAVDSPQSAQSGPGPAQSVQRCKCAFGDDTAAFLLPAISGGLVPFPGSQVQQVIHGQADVPAFLSWREAIRLDRAFLTVLLAGHVLIDAVPVVKAASFQDFALRAHQMMAPVVEVPGLKPCLIPVRDGWECKPLYSGARGVAAAHSRCSLCLPSATPAGAAVVPTAAEPPSILLWRRGWSPGPG